MDSRPKNLNLFTIRFPLTAIASILHRISGFVLFFLIPIGLWGLDLSLTGAGFDSIQQWFSSFSGKFLIWLMLMPFCFHFAAGIRHLLSDAHIGNSRKGGKQAVLILFTVFVVLAVLTGAWLW